ncbi:pirin family protein [Myxococcus qinghaiensis]|uniref:pirin family protein n=1 Tax=Myxococcus qinghaiensis TaxID=2906758 RepID=UPI0020A79FE7|nr:pirin family protein [Myxococcus qinghaiensis]MCP3169757.1 pirin family protein [Myxococcus qinghaiensis]
MAWKMPEEPYVDAEPGSALETVIVPRTRDLGDGFEVRRALPSSRRRMVGPFIFLDQMGPSVLQAGKGLDVRPHPHIGLATVTYLFDGEVLHRDSLGVVQTIRPGAVNWMVAGRGIVHSERTPPEARVKANRLFGIQFWVALPGSHEEVAPSFEHTPAEALPVIKDHGLELRLIAGELFGEKSPARTQSPLFYADVKLDVGTRLPVPTVHEERGLFIAEGQVEVGGESFGPGQLLVLRPGADVVARGGGAGQSRLLLFGGEPMDGPRHIWWNFVSSSKERIEQAKEDWMAKRIGQVPGETEFIPLPEPEPDVPRYP